MRKVLIIGATSTIAEACARLFANRGDSLYLVARNTERLEAIGNDLSLRGAGSVSVAAMDVNRLDHHEKMLEQALEALGQLDIVLIAHGTLPDQKACETSVETCLQEINTNAISTIALLTRLANVMETQGQGSLAVITSVAGDRGRQSNYVYGSAKAMVATFLQGLRNRLHAYGVQVLTIKPGFVDTPMTASFKKGLLWAQPDDIAEGIVRAMEKNKREVYLPFYWRYIMLLIRHIPERLFVRLSL